MIDKHYNPAIAARLRTLVEGQRWPDLLLYLDTLSNAHFRTAGYMLGEVLMPALSEADFWTLAHQLVSWNSKAFLVTLLKHAPAATCQEAHDFFVSLRGNAEDVRKVMLIMLPTYQLPAEVVRFLSWLDISDPHLRINAFLQSTTQPTAFLLVKALHEVEDDRALLVRTTYYLMKRGDTLSFNLASLIKSLFALDEVKGTFSLRLQPYALSHLMADFAAFQKALKL